jgi:hypothetical protein
VLIGDFSAETCRSSPARKAHAVPLIQHLASAQLSATAARRTAGVDHPPHTVLSTMAVRLLSALALQKISRSVEMEAVEMERRVKVVLLEIVARVTGGVAPLLIIVWLQTGVRVLLGPALRLAGGMFCFARRLLAWCALMK